MKRKACNIKPTVSRTSKNIRELRQKRGESQTELAAALGVTQTYISLLEDSKATPGYKLVKKLAEYFNCSPALFFE